MLKFWKREKTPMDVVASRLRVGDEFLFSSTRVWVWEVDTQDPKETVLRVAVLTDSRKDRLKQSIYITLPSNLRLKIKR